MWLALMTAAALLLPGAGIELTLHVASPGAYVRVVRAFLLSFAFWPIAIFLTRFPFLSLGVLAWAGLAFGAALVVRAVRARARLRERPRDAWEVAAAAAFFVIAIAHPLSTTQWPVAPGSDMTMHTFMARLIVEAGRLPTSYEPLYPIHDFGSYAAGLPATAAVLSTLSGAPVRVTSIVVALLTYPALAGGLSLVARRFAGPVASLGAAWLVVATCELHAYLMWGGNPTVLSFGLVFAAVAPLADLRAPEPGDGRLLFPLFAAGAGLVHVIPLMGMTYALPLALAIWFVRVPRGDRWRTLRAWSGPLAMAAALLAIPFVFGARPHVSTNELEWIQRWQRTTGHGFHETAHGFLKAIGPYLLLHFWLGVIVLGAGVVAQAAIRDVRQLAWAPYVIVTLLLVLNCQYWILPGSPALYPERMLVLLLAPGAALTAQIFARGWKATERFPIAARLAAFGLVGAGLAAWASSRAYLAIERATDRIPVTPDDLAAIAWIERETPPGAVIANNYGDAGLWIPALAFRAITSPHTNPFYFDEIEAWRRRTAATYLFVGEREVGDLQYPRNTVFRQPGRYRLVHEERTTDVFMILDPRPSSPGDPFMGH